jgi:hypothetical protein
LGEARQVRQAAGEAQGRHGHPAQGRIVGQHLPQGGEGEGPAPWSR